MGGVDKGLVLLNGQPMIHYVLNDLSHHFSDITISTNNDAGYASIGYPTVRDISTSGTGPLAGIYAGLNNATTQRVLIVPCDCPLLDTGLHTRLLAAMDKHRTPIVVAHDGERIQPTFTIIETALANNLLQYLNRGGRRLITWFKEQNAIEVDFSDYKELFTNVNTPSDLKQTEQHLTDP